MKKERLGLMDEGDDWAESDISSSGTKKVDFRGVSRLLKGSKLVMVGFERLSWAAVSIIIVIITSIF